MKEVILKIIMIISLFFLAQYGYELKGFIGLVLGLAILLIPLYIYYMLSEYLPKAPKYFQEIYKGIVNMLPDYNKKLFM